MFFKNFVACSGLCYALLFGGLVRPWQHAGSTQLAEICRLVHFQRISIRLSKDITKTNRGLKIQYKVGRVFGLLFLLVFVWFCGVCVALWFIFMGMCRFLCYFCGVCVALWFIFMGMCRFLCCFCGVFVGFCVGFLVVLLLLLVVVFVWFFGVSDFYVFVRLC